MTEVNEMLVAMTFVNSPKKSTRRASQQLSIPRTSLQRVMGKLKLNPHRPRLIHGLLEDDQHRWLQFCQLIHAHITNEQPDLPDKIIRSDEACFKLSGQVNRHSCVCWDNKNPHLTIESKLNQPGITTLGALSSEGVIGTGFLH